MQNNVLYMKYGDFNYIVVYKALGIQLANK